MRLLVYVFLFSFIVSCSSEAEQISNTSIKDTITLNEISDKIEINKGDILKYYFEALPSADLRSGYNISNPKAIKHLKTEETYSNYNPDDDGADRIEGVYLFKASKQGNCTLTFTSYLHGDIESENIIDIEVKQHLHPPLLKKQNCENYSIFA